MRPLSSAGELLRADGDEAELAVPRILAVVEEGQEELERRRAQGLLARPRLAAGSRAREGDEILEADGHRDRPERTEAVALEPAPHRAGQRAGALHHERRVQGVDLERLLLADRLALPLVRHRALRETAGLGEEVPAPAAEPLRELGPLERPEIGDGPDVTLVQEMLGLGSDPRNDPDPQRIEKRLDLLRSHDREPVGLLEIGGDLGDELVGTYAHRGGQPFLAHDLRLEPAGALDRGVDAAERRELEIRLLDAGLLEGVARGGEERPDARRGLPVEGVVGPEQHRLRPAPASAGMRRLRWQRVIPAGAKAAERGRPAKLPGNGNAARPRGRNSSGRPPSGCWTWPSAWDPARWPGIAPFVCRPRRGRRPVRGDRPVRAKD